MQVFELTYGDPVIPFQFCCGDEQLGSGTVSALLLPVHGGQIVADGAAAASLWVAGDGTEELGPLAATILDGCRGAKLLPAGQRASGACVSLLPGMVHSVRIQPNSWYAVIPSPQTRCTICFVFSHIQRDTPLPLDIQQGLAALGFTSCGVADGHSATGSESPARVAAESDGDSDDSQDFLNDLLADE